MNKSIVTTIINNWDPIDLLPYAPQDEYHVEIDLIVKLMDGIKDINELAVGIYNIFIKEFGGDVFTESLDQCTDVAKKILHGEN